MVIDDVGLALEDVSFAYPDGTLALSRLTLGIGEREVVSLTGPTGSGKTTALRVAAGLARPSTGVVRVAGRVVSDAATGHHVPTRERDIALVNDRTLYSHLSVRDNLTFALRVRKTPTEETERRVGAEARALRIDRLLDRLPRTLSAGHRQRVALGKATSRVPKAYLFDEPLGQLDPHARAQARAEFVRVQRGLGVPTLYVTHDQQEAMALSDRVAVLDAGRLRQVDTPRRLYAEPADTFVASFIGAPGMSLIAATLRFVGTVATFDVAASELRLTDTQRRALSDRSGPVCLGVRAEDVWLDPAPGRWRVPVTIDHVEYLGTHLLAAASWAGQRLDARLPAGGSIRPGERVELRIEAAKAHVFDATTGHALLRPRPP